LGFIHATRGGWEHIPLLKDQLLESPEKLLKVLKELTVAEEEKQKKEAALIDAWKAVSDTNSKASRAEEDARAAQEATEKAKEEAASQRNRLLRPGRRPLRLRKKQQGIRVRPSTSTRGRGS
jgi:hypothetical protein